MSFINQFGLQKQGQLPLHIFPGNRGPYQIPSLPPITDPKLAVYIGTNPPISKLQGGELATVSFSHPHPVGVILTFNHLGVWGIRPDQNTSAKLIDGKGNAHDIFCLIGPDNTLLLGSASLTEGLNRLIFDNQEFFLVTPPQSGDTMQAGQTYNVFSEYQRIKDAENSQKEEEKRRKQYFEGHDKYIRQCIEEAEKLGSQHDVDLHNRKMLKMLSLEGPTTFAGETREYPCPFVFHAATGKIISVASSGVLDRVFDQFPRAVLDWSSGKVSFDSSIRCSDSAKAAIERLPQIWIQVRDKRC